MNNPPRDPSFLIHPEVLPHLHLVSSFPYASKAGIDLREIIGFLRQAPHIARDKAPFYWAFLEQPQDGTTYLTWQPLAQRDVQAATDGYFWAGAEVAYAQDAGDGLILEMYLHKAGFAHGRDPITLRSRHRFRLVAAGNNPNGAAPHDPSLWIVHWGHSEPENRIPYHKVPIDERMAALMRNREFFHRMGELPRKEFVFSDSANWPSITPNPNGVSMTGTTIGIPQQMAYPPQQQQMVPGPPAKRARHAANANIQAAAAAASISLENPLNDEEDNWRGDFMDHVTPRELALERFQMNHEWMEEIVASPYRMGQIDPPDLGLGLQGELSKLTQGIFVEPSLRPGTTKGGANTTAIAAPGRLDPKLAEEFRNRIKTHLETTEDEIEKIKEEHEKQLAEIKKRSTVFEAEKALRKDADEAQILANIEEQLGLKARPQHMVERIQDGGYQAPVPVQPAPPVTNSQAGGDTDVDMGGIANAPPAINPTNNNFAQPQQHPSRGGTPANSNMPPRVSPHPGQGVPPQMGASGGQRMPASHLAADQGTGTGSGDWVMVPPGGVSPNPNPMGSGGAGVAQGMPPRSSETPSGAGGMDNDYGGMGEFNSAGEALDMNMDMENSAFGDAFHAGSASGTPADGNGQEI